MGDPSSRSKYSQQRVKRRGRRDRGIGLNGIGVTVGLGQELNSATPSREFRAQIKWGSFNTCYQASTQSRSSSAALRHCNVTDDHVFMMDD
jgi:hypothetical protein